MFEVIEIWYKCGGQEDPYSGENETQALLTVIVWLDGRSIFLGPDSFDSPAVLIWPLRLLAELEIRVVYPVKMYNYYEKKFETTKEMLLSFLSESWLRLPLRTFCIQ